MAARRLIAACLIAATVALSTAAGAKSVVIAYVPTWIDLKSFAQTIDYSKLTHIDIAFVNPIDEQGRLSVDDGADALIERARKSGVKILASIGGGSASGSRKMAQRYARLLEPAQRGGFVARLANYVVQNKYDGLDVDLEGPAIDDHYGAFIADLAKALHAKGKLLTAAVSQGYGGEKIPNSTFAQFDFVNIMAYDGAGPWDPKSPGQHSSLRFARDNVDYWLGRGLPKSKAVLGLPFYGYGFGKAFRKSDYSYGEIVAAHPGAEKTDQTGSTIWYNGIPTIKAKTRYAMDKNLAGVMIWSLDGDAPGEKSLLAAIHEVLITKPPRAKQRKEK